MQHSLSRVLVWGAAEGVGGRRVGGWPWAPPGEIAALVLDVTNVEGFWFVAPCPKAGQNEFQISTEIISGKRPL